MKLRIVSTCLTALLVLGAYGSLSARSHRFEHAGLSASELQNLVNALPPTPGTIQSIEFLRSDGFSIDRAAILMQLRDSGWQILVFYLKENGQFSPEWTSGPLRDSFAVSSSRAFRTVTVGTAEQALEFSGCAAHNCPDIFSFILYSPLKKAAFTATYAHGKINYSPNLEAPDSRAYKDALGRYVKQRSSE
jgi:hypothetical protein